MRWDDEPTLIDLVHALGEALGYPRAARPDPPAVVWEEYLAEVRQLRDIRENLADNRYSSRPYPVGPPHALG